MPHNKWGQINIVLPPVLLVLDLELLLKSSQNSSEGKENRETRCVFPVLCLPRSRLDFFSHLWRCCSLGEVTRTKLIQLYLRYPGGTSSSMRSPLWAELLNCLICSVLAQSPCALTAAWWSLAVVTACHWCKVLPPWLQACTEHRTRIETSGRGCGGQLTIQRLVSVSPWDICHQIKGFLRAGVMDKPQLM